jgi:hypothetical protein
VLLKEGDGVGSVVHWTPIGDCVLFRHGKAGNPAAQADRVVTDVLARPARARVGRLPIVDAVFVHQADPVQPVVRGELFREHKQERKRVGVGDHRESGTFGLGH